MIRKFVSVTLLLSIFVCFSQTNISFPGKQSYFLGTGTYLSKSFNLERAELYEHSSSTKAPFKMNKKGNGAIDIYFDASLLDASQLEDGKSYSASFPFTHKNIGKVYYLTVSAKYENQFILKATQDYYEDVNLSPETTEANIVIAAKSDSRTPFIYEIPEDIKSFIEITPESGFSIKKGDNPITIKIVESQNFEGEVKIYQNVSGRELNSLYLNIKSTGFSDKVQLEEKKPIVDDTIIKEKDATIADLRAKLIAAETKASESGSSTGLLGFVLAGVFAVIAILLFTKLKKSSRVEKELSDYSELVEKVASLLDIDFPEEGGFEKYREEIVLAVSELSGKATKTDSDLEGVSLEEDEMDAINKRVEELIAKGKQKSNDDEL